MVQIESWLSAPDPSSNYENALEIRLPGTGSWLLNSDELAAWKGQPGTFLWLYGIRESEV